MWSLCVRIWSVLDQPETRTYRRARVFETLIHGAVRQAPNVEISSLPTEVSTCGRASLHDSVSVAAGYAHRSAAGVDGNVRQRLLHRRIRHSMPIVVYQRRWFRWCYHRWWRWRSRQRPCDQADHTVHYIRGWRRVLRRLLGAKGPTELQPRWVGERGGRERGERSGTFLRLSFSC